MRIQLQVGFAVANYNQPVLYASWSLDSVDHDCARRTHK